MANVAKKVSWSGRDPRDDDDDDDDEDGNGDGPAGESTPLLNGTGHGARQVGPGGAPGALRAGHGAGAGAERGLPAPGGAAAGPRGAGAVAQGGPFPSPTSPSPGYRELGSPGRVPAAPRCEPLGAGSRWWRSRGFPAAVSTGRGILRCPAAGQPAAVGSLGWF